MIFFEKNLFDHFYVINEKSLKFPDLDHYDFSFKKFKKFQQTKNFNLKNKYEKINFFSYKFFLSFQDMFGILFINVYKVKILYNI